MTPGEPPPTEHEVTWGRFRPRRRLEALALVGAIAFLLVCGGALAWAFDLTGGSSTSWRERLDASCLAGYGSMIEAAQLPLLTDRLDAEARVESDWVSRLNNDTGHLPSSDSVDVNTYVHAKRSVLRIRTQIANGGSATPVLRQKLTYAQRYAQVLAGQLELSVCGRQDATLE